MNTNLLKQYAALNEQFKILENERESLRTQIINEFRENGVEKQNTTYGHFSIGRRAFYIYSDNIKKLQEKVKLAQIKEQNNGKADKKFTEYLIFKEPGSEDVK